MLTSPLAGRLILLVEDEPLIAIELDSGLRTSGARVVSAGYVEAGLFTTEHPDLSAAIVDLHLGDGSGLTVCRRLRHLRVPFLIYTGYPHMLIATEWSDVPVISKPARSQDIITQLAQMLA